MNTLQGCLGFEKRCECCNFVKFQFRPTCFMPSILPMQRQHMSNIEYQIVHRCTAEFSPNCNIALIHACAMPSRFHICEVCCHPILCVWRMLEHNNSGGCRRISSRRNIGNVQTTRKETEALIQPCLTEFTSKFIHIALRCTMLVS